MGSFVVNTNQTHVWDTSRDIWLFYGQVSCECSKDDNADTFTIKVTGIANYGREWNFQTHYSINLNGKTASGTIPASGSGTHVGWCPTDNSWYTGGLPISTTVSANADGSCPDVNLYVRVYNDSIYYINKEKYVSYSAVYDGNVAPKVRTLEGKCSMVTPAGVPAINSITSNYDGTFSTTSTMGTDGTNNTVSNIHIYYGIGNVTSPTTVPGTYTAARGNGTVNDRTVTHLSMPLYSTADYVDVYARPYNITSTGSNNGGDVKHARLQNWQHCDGATVNSITDNGDNTFTVVTTKGAAGYNNSVSTVHIYMHKDEGKAQAGQSSYGLSNGKVNGSTVTFENIPMSTFRNAMGITDTSKPFTLWCGAHSIAAKGNNMCGEQKSAQLRYYETPRMQSFSIVPDTESGSDGGPVAQFTYACDSDCEWRIGKTATTGDWRDTNITLNGNGTYTVTYKLSDVGTESAAITYYVTARRADNNQFVSNTLTNAVDLRNPELDTNDAKIQNITVTARTVQKPDGSWEKTEYSTCSATIQVAPKDMSTSKGAELNWEFYEGSVTGEPSSKGSILNTASSQDLTVNLTPNTLANYVLVVYQKNYPQLRRTEVEYKGIDTTVPQLETSTISFDTKLNTNTAIKDCISTNVGKFYFESKLTDETANICGTATIDIKTVGSSRGTSEVCEIHGGNITHTFGGSTFSFLKTYYLSAVTLTHKNNSRITHQYIPKQENRQLCGGTYVRDGSKMKKSTPIVYTNNKTVRAVPFVCTDAKNNIWKIVTIKEGE